MYYLWYNERMKYPKINLKEVREQARQFQAEHPRLLLVFLLPSILFILSSFVRPLSLLDEGILEQSFLSFSRDHNPVCSLSDSRWIYKRLLSLLALSLLPLIFLEFLRWSFPLKIACPYLTTASLPRHF